MTSDKCNENETIHWMGGNNSVGDDVGVSVQLSRPQGRGVF
ncbi:MAG: hypothetical protein V9G20_17370 [Candidatus Promineifilaceae bacterium]